MKASLINRLNFKKYINIIITQNMNKTGNIITILTFTGFVIILIITLMLGSYKTNEIGFRYILILFIVNSFFIIVLLFHALIKLEFRKNFKTIGYMLLNIPVVFLYLYLMSFTPKVTTYFDKEEIDPFIYKPETSIELPLSNYKSIDRELFIDTTLTLDFEKYFTDIESSNIINSNSIDSLCFINNFDDELGGYPQLQTNYPINEKYGIFRFQSMRVPSFFPIFIHEINNYIILSFSISISSSSSIYHPMYILAFSKEGVFIDGLKTGFSFGKGDILLYNKSKFVEKYNNAGYTEVLINKHTIEYHNSSLRVFNNGSEIVYSEYAEIKLNDKGKLLIDGVDTEEITYYKTGILNWWADRKIALFK